MLSRRETLKAVMAAGAVTAAAGSWAVAVAEEAMAPARDWAIPFGAAVRDGPFADEPAYREALKRHCRQIVSEGGMKWQDVRPSRDRFVFDSPDRHLAFASANGMELRGHTLAWYGAMPDWTRAIASPAEAERELVGHIETVVGRYRGRIRSWDVVNEPIPDDPSSRSDLRPSIWTRRLGESYIALALRTTARVDPQAGLVMNEYDIEFVGPRFRRKREALLRLIRDLKLRNLPLTAIGLQGHLRAELAIDKEGLSAFVSEVRSLGLDVLVTELDVIDDKLPGPPGLRDAIVAAKAYDFLDAIFAAARPTAILTWGITDRHTWVPIWFRRRDGLANRPLPLDEAYRPKPLMRVIEHFARAPG